MSLLRNVLKLNRLTATGEANQSFRFLIINSPKCFSTEAPPPVQASVPIDQNYQSASSGEVYGAFSTKIALKNTLKKDIIRIFDGSNLSPDDIKVMYTPEFLPIKTLIKFRDMRASDNAMRTLKNSDGHRLIRTNRNEWDTTYSHGGQSLLLEGLPRNALQEDVERLLSGCDYYSMKIFPMQVNRVQKRVALVKFPSPTLAMSAYVIKNRGFCLNNEISIRVLQ